MKRKQSHCDRVLALLRDGKPHTHHELYALQVVAHSRVAELRARGHLIAQQRVGDDYVYQLLSERAVGVVASVPPVALAEEDTGQFAMLLWEEAA